ncbi:MAG: GDP-mannose 4,6-dehydratase, partial [Crocinitomicaceae bacterium]
GAHSSSLIGELPSGEPSNLLPYVTQTALGILDELTVYGKDYNTTDGTCVRDFIHVSDLADAHVKGLDWLLQQTGSFNEVVNVGTGQGSSVLEIIHTFEKVSNRQLNWKFGDRRKGDVEQIYADVTKAKELLNWSTQRSMEDAVRDAWNWEQKWRNETTDNS